MFRQTFLKKYHRSFAHELWLPLFWNLVYKTVCVCLYPMFYGNLVYSTVCVFVSIYMFYRNLVYRTVCVFVSMFYVILVYRTMCVFVSYVLWESSVQDCVCLCIYLYAP